MRNFFRQIVERPKPTKASKTPFSLSPRDTRSPASSPPNKTNWRRRTNADYEVDYNHPYKEDIHGFVHTGTLRILEGRSNPDESAEEERDAQGSSDDAAAHTMSTNTVHELEASTAASRRIAIGTCRNLSVERKGHLDRYLETEARVKAIDQQLDTVVGDFEAKKQDFLAEKRKLEDQRVELRAEMETQWKSVWDA